MTAQSTYVITGNREDLGDIIFDVSPSDTPLLSAIKKVKATSTKHEWLTDSLASPAADNAAVEGADMGTPADDAEVRMYNYTQILTKDAKVTGTQEKGMNPAGRNSEMNRQIAKKTKEIKTDWEMSVMGTNNAYAAGNASTAREMASISCYLGSNTSFNATGGADATKAGPDPDAGSTARTDGTQRAILESYLTSVLSDCFDNGGNPSMALTGSFNKGKISAFTGGGTHYVDKDDKKLVNAVDIYVGDFHTLKVIPSRHVRARDVLVIDPSYLACATSRPLHTNPIAPTGDAVKKQLIWESTLEVCNEAAHGGIFDLTTS